MTRSEAEKLLGGHATGTLTEEERRNLFVAALGDQALFDALMDEEALRELLADRAMRALLLAALAPAAAPKVVPFWRRTGVLGAAASLLVAATAGLMYLRSPERVPPPLEERETPAKAKVAEAPALGQAPAPLAEKAPPAAPAQASVPPPAERAKAPAAALAKPIPAAQTAGAGAPQMEAESRAKEQDQYRRVEARDQLAKKAEAPRPAAALMEVAPAPRADKQKVSAESQISSPGAVLGGVVGGAIGGGVSGPASKATGAAQDGRLRDTAASPVAAAPAKSARRTEWKAAGVFAPAWTLEPRPDGLTRVSVLGPAGTQAVLLRRRVAGVDVLALKVLDSGSDQTRWQAEIRLAPGDALDLYLLNAPVAEPAKLPETGLLEGFRVRIHPVSKD